MLSLGTVISLRFGLCSDPHHEPVCCAARQALLKVLHLSTTPLVGAPGNLCRALNEAGLAKARWAVLDDAVGTYRTMAYSLDLLWKRDRDEIMALVRESDLLHLHNFIDLGNRDFYPLDFEALWEAGKPIVRQFHSQPGLVARAMGQTEAQVQDCPIPKLVIAQYPERAYPTAQLVRNLVYVPPRAPRVGNSRSLRVGFAPSRFNSARSARWDTKGYPETVLMLQRLERMARRSGVSLEIDLITQTSHEECLRRKALCDLFVDDLVTGSYHLNTLESLAMGIPCATYLDDRTRNVVRQVTGGAELPVLNVPLEDAADVLLEACTAPALLPALGDAASAWMAEHWAPESVARDLANIYQRVHRSPRAAPAARFDASSATVEWQVTGQDDARWRARHAHWPRPLPAPLARIKGVAGKIARAMKLR